MLRVERLCVRYGPVPALVDVDLEVGPGEVVALVGANGSGRTTLLRVLEAGAGPGPAFGAAQVFPDPARSLLGRTRTGPGRR